MVSLKQTNIINIILLDAATFCQFVVGSSAECVDDYNITACVGLVAYYSPTYCQEVQFLACFSLPQLKQCKLTFLAKMLLLYYTGTSQPHVNFTCKGTVCCINSAFVLI